MIVNKYNNGGGGSSSGVTPQDVQRQIDSALTPYWDSGETKDYVDGAVSGISLDGYYTSAQTDAAIAEAVAGKADAKIFVDFDKTTQAERASLYAELKALYDGGSGATINKTYDFYKTVNTWQGLKIDYYSFSGGSLVFGKVISPENITDQVVYEQVMTIDAEGNVAVVTNTVGGVDLSGYYTSAQTEEAISAATSGKADAANVTANTNNLKFPYWNEQGVVTGSYYKGATTKSFGVNGKNIDFFVGAGSANLPTFYAPLSAGTAGEILVSTGNGAPVWSAMTFITSADVETQIEAKGYITSADTADFLDDEDGLVISSAINDLRGLIEVISAATPEVDLSGYYDSAQTEQAITSKGYVTSAQVETQIAAKNYITSGQVKDQVEAYNYATVSQLPVVPTSNTAFTNDAKYVNSAETKAQIEAYNYVTSAQVETQILSKNYITSADTTDFLDDEDGLVISTAMNNLDGRIEDVSDHLDEVERITASAYTELHDGILALSGRIDTMDETMTDAISGINGELANKVTSYYVSTIWKGTQAEYDAITVKDPATFYIIVSSN